MYITINLILSLIVFFIHIFLFFYVKKNFKYFFVERFLNFLNIYILFAYTIKGFLWSIFDENNFEKINNSMLVILFFVLTYFIFFKFLKTGEGFANYQDNEYKINYFYLFSSIFMLIIFTNISFNFIQETSVGVLSRHSYVKEYFLSGIIVRFHDRLVPIFLLSFLLLSICFNKKLSILVMILVSFSYFYQEVSIRLTKMPIAIFLLFAYFSIPKDIKSKRLIILFFLATLLSIIPLYELGMSSRTNQHYEITQILNLIYNRIVGFEQLQFIVAYILENDLKILFHSEYNPASYFTQIIRAKTGLHAEAPGLFGYFILQFGIFSLFMFALFIYFFFKIIFLLDNNKNIYFVVIFFSLVFVETVGFFIDGNDTLVVLSFSTLRRFIVYIFIVPLLMFISKKTFYLK